MRFNHIKNSVLAGELSPKVHGRTDLSQYQHGCEELTNMIPLPQGGAIRRPGTRFIQSVAGAESARLVPFIPNQNESYVGVFAPSSKKAINAASPGTSITTLTLGMGATWTNYARPDAYQIQYTQSADVLYLVHPNYRPQRMIRVGANSFGFVNFDWNGSDATYGSINGRTDPWDRFPYRDFNVDAAWWVSVSTPDVVTNIATMTSSKALFDAGHVGAYFKVSIGATTGYVVVTAVTDSQHATVQVMVDVGSTATTAIWAESSWSDYRGWPRAVCFFEGRLIYAGNKAQPDTLWGSRISAYDFMNAPTSGVAATDPFIFTLSSQQVNAVQWLSPGKTLVIGTLGSEHVMMSADPNAALGPGNVTSSVETTHGSAYVQAKRVAYMLLFTQRTGKRINELMFSFQSDSYVSENLSQLADHMTSKNGPVQKIRQIDWQESLGVLWCVDDSGALFGVTRDKNEGISAWHFHKPGGVCSGATPITHSIAILPEDSGKYDEIWCCVERTVNGAQAFHIEVIGKEFDGVTLNDAWTAGSGDAPYFLDSALALTNGSPQTTWTAAAPHLVGQTVSILADGLVHPDVVVGTGGDITLAAAASKIVVGLKYISKFKTLPIEAGAQIGSAQGQIKRIDHTTMKFYRTCAASFGAEEGKLEDIDFTDPQAFLNTPIPVTTDDIKREFPGDYDTKGQVILETDEPLPMGITAIISRGVLSE